MIDLIYLSVFGKRLVGQDIFGTRKANSSVDYYFALSPSILFFVSIDSPIL